MICLSFEQAKSYQHVYYFLYNDCLILFEDSQSGHKAGIDPDQEENSNILRIIPLTHLHSYYIPEEQGIPHGIQIVFIPLMENIRSSFTIVFPTSDDKTEFIQELHNAFNHITKTHISFPVVRFSFLFTS